MKFIKKIATDVIAVLFGLPLALLFLVAAVPILVVIGVTGWGRTAKVSRQEVVRYIDDFLAGTGGDWDWDDFTSIPIADRDLDAVRQTCAAASETWPATEPNQYCSPEGLAELRRIADRLREPLSNEPLQKTKSGKAGVE